MSATARHDFFRYATATWLVLYLLSILVMGTSAWVSAPVYTFVDRDGLPHLIEQALINRLSPAACMAICIGLIALTIMFAGHPRWWSGLLIWFLFRIVTHRMWLASNGGIQLMENMLLWSSFIHLASSARPLIAALGLSAFWIARLQLLLAYGAAAAHKFTGTTWLDGSAVWLVTVDTAFSLHWLSSFPLLCSILTWSTLAFMSFFPLAVWWGPTRRSWLFVGVLFHLSTALFMGIPQMGLAFIVCYALWLKDDEAKAIMGRFRLLGLRIRATRQPG